MKNAGMWVLVAVAALILAINMGSRSAFGLFLSPINTGTGLGIAAISFAAAVNQLMWGAWQPVFGALADRFGAAVVVFGGGLLLAAGTAMIPYTDSAAGLVLSLGIVSAAGAAAGSMSVLFGAIGQRIPPERRGFATGIVNAGGSAGQMVFAPVVQAIITAAGWVSAMFSLAAIALATLPLAWLLRQPRAAGAAKPAGPGMRAALGEAAGSPSYWYLQAGFFVCGFHVAFLLVHMPGVIELCGLPPSVAGTSLALIGLFNIAGSLLAGMATQRWRMKLTLSALYAARAAGVALFLAAPKTELTVLVFSAWMGLTFLATIPPTAGLVGKLFGVRYLATLFGITLFSHQVGAFFGAWLGGVAFERTGSYDWMWYADIALAIFAALIHLPIREARVVRAAPAAA